MADERLKDVMRRFYEEVFNRGNLGVIDELVSDDMVEHQPPMPGYPGGKEGLRQWVMMIRTAFPDCSMEIEDMAVDGDKIWVRSSFHGTNTGPMMGMPATGKPVQADGIDIMRVDRNGRTLEHWGVFDQAAMMQQLGMVQSSGEQHD